MTEIVQPIPARLKNVAVDGHVAGASDIIDDTLNKDQATINSEVTTALGTGGSVDSRIAAAKAEIKGNATSACDTLGEAEALISAEATRAEAAEEALDGRVDTLENAVGTGGSVDSRIATAKSEIIGDAASDYNTLGKIEDKLSPIETAIENCAYLENDDSSAVIADFDPQADTVWKKQQTLSAAEKVQVKANLGLDTELENLRQLYEALTQSDIEVVNEVPASGVANKIYRVVGESSYADYMFNANALTIPIKMAEYDNAIDDDVIGLSQNLVKNAAVYDSTRKFLTKPLVNKEYNYSDFLCDCILDDLQGNIRPKNASLYEDGILIPVPIGGCSFKMLYSSTTIMSIAGYSARPTLTGASSVFVGRLDTNWPSDGIFRIDYNTYKYVLISCKGQGKQFRLLFYGTANGIDSTPISLSNSLITSGGVNGADTKIASNITKPIDIKTFAFPYTVSTMQGDIAVPGSNDHGYLIPVPPEGMVISLVLDSAWTLLNFVGYSDLPTPSNASSVFVDFINLNPQRQYGQHRYVIPYATYKYVIVSIRQPNSKDGYFIINRSDKFMTEQKIGLIDKVKMDSGFGSIIHSWGFIGDSLSSGTIEAMEGGQHSWGVTDYNFSWPQRLCKLLGVDGYNFSVPSQTCYGWINGYGDSNRNWAGAQTNLKDSYVISLGYNDPYGSGGNPAEELGEPSDINLADYTQNANTFYGLYAGIIQRLRSLRPKCYIFVVTIPTHTPGTWNTAIKYMATIFDNVYVIDLSLYSSLFSKSDFADVMMMGDHMSPAGYQWVAYLMNALIDRIIQDNFDKFKGSAYIGNDNLEPF